MVKSVKVILVFLFAVLLYHAANNYFTGQTVREDDSIALTSLAENMPEAVVDIAKQPCLPDAELLACSIQLQQITISRIQRINVSEYLLSLKGVARKLIECEAALTRHWGRIYNTTVSYFCYPASEYYVFALRRIIV